MPSRSTSVHLVGSRPKWEEQSGETGKPAASTKNSFSLSIIERSPTAWIRPPSTTTIWSQRRRVEKRWAMITRMQRFFRYSRPTRRASSVIGSSARAGRFVHNHQVRVPDKHAGDCEALDLPAGEGLGAPTHRQPCQRPDGRATTSS